MKKKYLIMLVIILILLASLLPIGANMLFSEDLKQSETYDNKSIALQVNEDGYYSMLGEVTLNYSSEHGLDYITIQDPTLLSFSVSSEYNGGVWILDLKEGEQILHDLDYIESQLETSDNQELS